jgi:hypothetical protein
MSLGKNNLALSDLNIVLNKKPDFTQVFVAVNVIIDTIRLEYVEERFLYSWDVLMAPRRILKKF